MTGRHGWRLTAMISVVCWCGLAGGLARGQQPGRPRMQGVLINNLSGVRPILPEASPAVQPGTEFEAFREHVDRELLFIGRACPLTADERHALAEAHSALLDTFKSLFAEQPGNVQLKFGGARRVGAFNGRVVAFDAHGRRQADFLDRLARAQIEAVVQDSLSKESLAKLEAERVRFERRVEAADVLALLAVMDEAVLLDARQIATFRDFLEPAWHPVWGQVAANRVTGRLATPLQTAGARHLGELFDQLDAHLTKYLREGQREFWREMGPRQQASRAAHARMLALESKRVVKRSVRNADGQLVVVDHIVRVAPAQPPRPQRAAAEQQAADTGEAPAVSPPRELTLLLDLLVEDVVAMGQLSDAEREILLLAGKLDLGRYCAEEEARARETLRPAQDEQRNQQLPVQQSEIAATRNPFAAADSRFRKALASRLDQEQLARLAAADRKRRELRREAAVQSLVRQLDEAAKLTSAQWDALAVAIRRRQELSAAAVADDFQSESDACVSWIAKTDLQPIVDADQWPAVEQKLIELKRVARAAAMPGVPF